MLFISNWSILLRHDLSENIRFLRLFPSNFGKIHEFIIQGSPVPLVDFDVRVILTSGIGNRKQGKYVTIQDRSGESFTEEARILNRKTMYFSDLYNN